jgi:hypothetical protein
MEIFKGYNLYRCVYISSTKFMNAISTHSISLNEIQENYAKAFQAIILKHFPSRQL